MRIRAPVADPQTVTCLIPGHDQPGREVHAETLAVADAPLEFDLTDQLRLRVEVRLLLGRLAAALELLLAQLDAPDLAGERLRQVVDELDLARVGVGREVAADEAS